MAGPVRCLLGACICGAEAQARLLPFAVSPEHSPDAGDGGVQAGGH